MRNATRINILTWCAALACIGIGVPVSAGCQSAGELPTDSAAVTLEVRFQDRTAAQQPASASRSRFAGRTTGPTSPATGTTRHDEVARILVDITYTDTSHLLDTELALTELAPDVWRGEVRLLPPGQQLRFAARALDDRGEVVFSGEILATLTADHQDLQIPLAPVGGHETAPRLVRLAFPAEIFAGQEEQFAFTLQGDGGAAVGFRITPLGSSTPAAAFSPATGTVSLLNTVADFIAIYTAPSVAVDTTFGYQVTITDARAPSSVAVTTEFRTTVRPRPPGPAVVFDAQPGVRFNPVILGLTANGSETTGSVKLVATVSDDSAPDKLTYQWSYAPDPGSPDTTFAHAGQGNPGWLQGYTVAHQGTITLTVTDEHDGTTIVHYQIAPDQFADPVVHDPASAPGGASRQRSQAL